MSSWLVQAIVKGVLAWIKSLSDSFIQKRKHIEQGREEVLETINKQTEEFKSEVKRHHDPDRSVDDIADELRRRYERSVRNSTRVS